MKPKPWLTLLAGCVVTFTLGSVHAFSVFLLPLENLLQASRLQVSFVYSSALVSLTVMVLFGHRVYEKLSAAKLSALACLMAAGGLLIAASASSMVGLTVGYGIVFGAANGLGYGHVLQLVAQAMPAAAGLAMGAGTAFYAFGAVFFASFYAWLLLTRSPSETMQVMALLLLCAAGYVTAMMYFAGAAYRGEGAIGDNRDNADQRQLIFRLWIGYGAAVAAGLMLIGHATAIVMDAGGGAQLMFVGTMMIVGGNALGGIAVGLLVDRLSARLVLAFLSSILVIALSAMWLTQTASVTVALLAVLGMCYGVIIAVYPAAVVSLFGMRASARVYGRVFTAWGLAGLSLPWLAGYLFDLQGSYRLAIALAAGLSVVGAVMAFTLPRTVKLASAR